MCCKREISAEVNFRHLPDPHAEGCARWVCGTSVIKTEKAPSDLSLWAESLQPGQFASAVPSTVMTCPLLAYQSASNTLTAEARGDLTQS
jgi:hypothetical protein